MIRQGDVMLQVVSSLPNGSRKVPANGAVVLAEGEVTGHAHTMEVGDVEVYERDGTMYLKVLASTPLVHQEHDAITVDPGIYRVRRQREYTPEAIRNVAD